MRISHEGSVRSESDHRRRRAAFLAGLIATLGLSLTLETSAQATSYNLQRDKELIRKGLNYARAHRFSAAVYPFRTARIDIASLPNSVWREKQKVMEAIDLTVEKLRSGEAAWVILDFVEDCARVSLDTIREMEYKLGHGGDRVRYESLREAVRGAKTITKDVRKNRLRRANRKLREIQRLLNLPRNAYDTDLQRAAELSGLLAEKLNDYSLSLGEKINITRDCIKDIVRAIETSNRYRGGPVQGRRVVLGEVGKFDKWYYSRERLRVGQNKGAFRKLILRPTKDLHLDHAVITFGNGQTQRVYSHLLREDRPLHVDLHGGRRYITRIKFVGTTRSAFGSRARLKVVGVR